MVLGQDFFICQYEEKAFRQWGLKRGIPVVSYQGGLSSVVPLYIVLGTRISVWSCVLCDQCVCVYCTPLYCTGEVQYNVNERGLLWSYCRLPLYHAVVKRRLGIILNWFISQKKRRKKKRGGGIFRLSLFFYILVWLIGKYVASNLSSHRKAHHHDGTQRCGCDVWQHGLLHMPCRGKASPWDCVDAQQVNILFHRLGNFDVT